jgi:anti-anti-sigma factor
MELVIDDREVDAESAPAFRTRLFAAVTQAASAGEDLSVDFSAVEFLGSARIQALASGYLELEARDRRLSVVNATPIVSRTLEITGLEHLLGR